MKLETAQSERHELLVLGSGAGGKLLAWQMARSGHRTAVVERKLIGGSCPNTNCLPGKNEIWSAKVADLVHRAADNGRGTRRAVLERVGPIGLALDPSYPDQHLRYGDSIRAP
jgi:pyruvate/2-oxoglutarate dehydrogenase complex dihydrolipoamide dehydrogenase (E3) component